ncbi:MAG: DUF3014 domain-containing protein [Burkholderiales bacterium]
MRDPVKWIVAVLVLIGVALIIYFQWFRQEPEPQPQAPASADIKPLPDTGPPPEKKLEPKIQHPIAEPAETKPLPVLDSSDAAMKETLTGLFGQKTLVDFFYLDRIIRRIVATVDNLPRPKVSQRLIPLKPVPGIFLVTEKDDTFVIDPTNYSRYALYVRVAETVSIKKLVAAYIHFYPLFQQAYKELGYPTGYFNDRLVEVIDHMLAAPQVEGPVKLTLPSVMYHFADPGLESLSAGHKIMLRMGSANATRIKTRLRELRQEVAGRELKP